MKNPHQTAEGYWYDKPELHVARHSAEKIVPLLIEIAHPGSVVDVGCGIGFWLAEFIKRGVSDACGLRIEHEADPTRLARLPGDADVADPRGDVDRLEDPRERQPERDDEEWLRHITVSRNGADPEIDYAPVTITQWQPEERKY